MPPQVLQEMARKQHPYIVSLHQSFQDDLHLYLVMDFVGGGDLFALLEKRGQFHESWARVYVGEIALALQHLHEEGILYRDLKPENVMVALDGHLKLTDFGFAKKLDEKLITRGSCARRLRAPLLPASPMPYAPAPLACELHSFATPRPQAWVLPSTWRPSCSRGRSMALAWTGGRSAAFSSRWSPATAPLPTAACSSSCKTSPRPTHTSRGVSRRIARS